MSSVEDKLPDGWVETILNDICFKVTDGSHQSPKFFKGGKPMLSVKDMNEFGFDIENSKTISEEDYIKLISQGCKPEINDILIAKDGSVLKHIFRVKEEIEAVLLSSIAILKPKTELIIPQFLVYTLINPNFKKYILNNFLSGSGVPRIVLKDFKKIILNLPPIQEQKAIAKVLTAFDDKIENLRAQNQTLEQTAQTIFKEWFGKYQIGDELPEGWRVGKLGEVISKSNTGADAIKKAPIVEEDTGIRCLRIGDLSNNRSFDKWGFAKVTEKNFKQFQLKKFDILITRTSILGLNMMIMEDLNSVYNNGLIKISLINDISPFFIYGFFKSQFYKNYISMINNDTSTRPNMKIDYLLQFPIVLPTKQIELKFSEIYQRILNKVEVNIAQIQTLTQTRDALLPKLMRGEIRVNGFKK